ncbi:MAG: DUF2721 domain-containing protein [Phycisphaerae bacterium]|nr:DUF2721 domain-containing protein [Phycisphaerae bacterium]
MLFLSLSQLIPILQTAIGPVILISGVGLILLTMTNRLAQTVSRIRNLNDNLVSATTPGRMKVLAQIQVLLRRARLIRLAISLAAASALAVSVLIIVLFFMTLWHIEIAWVIALMFMISMICLILSLIVFIYDINQSLVALQLELSHNELSESDV